MDPRSRSLYPRQHLTLVKLRDGEQPRPHALTFRSLRALGFMAATAIALTPSGLRVAESLRPASIARRAA